MMVFAPTEMLRDRPPTLFERFAKAQNAQREQNHGDGGHRRKVRPKHVQPHAFEERSADDHEDNSAAD